VIAVRWLRARRLPDVLVFVSIGFGFGLLPFFLLILLAPAGPDGLEGLRRFFLGSFAPRLPSGLGMGQGLLGLVLYDLRFLAFNLAGPQLAFLPIGLVVLYRHRKAVFAQHVAVMSVGLLSPLLFPHLGDRYVLLLPTLAAAAVVAGAGVDSIPRLPRRARPLVVALCLLLPVATYSLLARTGIPGGAGFFRGASPEHARAFLWPGKRGDRSAAEFGHDVLAAVPRDAVLVSGWGDGRVILFLQLVRDVRPELPIVLRTGRRTLAAQYPDGGGRRVFVSNFPWLPLDVVLPEGTRLREVLPGALWELVAAESPR